MTFVSSPEAYSMTYDVCFVKTGKAFIPEGEAYCEYLESRGISTVIVIGEEQAKCIDARLFYRFGGVLRSSIKASVPEIHEYHTASVGQYPHLKNFLKSLLGSRPKYYSFLNSYVESQYYFSKRVPRFYRDMGAHSALMSIRKKNSNTPYDVCYFGTISQREGVLDTIIKLAGLGLSVVVAGNANEVDSTILRDAKGVTFLGTIDSSQIFDYLSLTKTGLNMMPNEYPLTTQTSTKVIEYLVAGLPIISNNYSWIVEHSAKHGYKFADIDGFSLDRFQSLLEDECSKLSVENAAQFTWESILDAIHFDRLIRSCMSS